MTTVLVVGGAGYIGSHMVAALAEGGYGAVTLDDLSRGHRELVLAGEFVRGDFGDAATLDRLFGERRIDAVMHFAAWSLVGESVARPLDYYRTNVGATAVLLDRKLAHEHMLADAARAHGLAYTTLRYFNAAGADPDGRLGEAHHPETHLIPLV